MCVCECKCIMSDRKGERGNKWTGGTDEPEKRGVGAHVGRVSERESEVREAQGIMSLGLKDEQ